MRTIEKWSWRYRWGGRNVTSPYPMTWEEVSREHPEAVRIPDTMVTVEVPETEEEKEAVRARVTRPSTARLGKS